jgi:hypothetical protein
MQNFQTAGGRLWEADMQIEDGIQHDGREEGGVLHVEVTRQHVALFLLPNFGYKTLLCDIDTPDTTLHRLMTCQNILRKTSRVRFWETLSNTCPRGSDYLNSLPTVQQLYIILELIELKSMTREYKRP